MDVKSKDQKISGTIFPEKRYTQREVDGLLEKKEKDLASQALVTEEVSQTVNIKKQLDKKTVANLIKRSNRILVSISTHAFPFDFFPNTLNVEEGRISIIKRHFLSSEVHSIDIKDISNVFINTIFIFAQLVIVSKTFEQNEVKIRNLRPKEAIFARRIIEGLRVFKNKQIETSRYSKKELIAKLEELSTTKIVT
ncbi:MAG: hypothetical protein NUV65_00745 [Candidatus Roizmanbacteria bacterium]|nr:hypothetical protein [Candidatus Roizmanbacteria bacterium]